VAAGVVDKLTLPLNLNRQPPAAGNSVVHVVLGAAGLGGRDLLPPAVLGSGVIARPGQKANRLHAVASACHRPNCTAWLPPPPGFCDWNFPLERGRLLATAAANPCRAHDAALSRLLRVTQHHHAAFIHWPEPGEFRGLKLASPCTAP